MLVLMPSEKQPTYTFILLNILSSLGKHKNKHKQNEQFRFIVLILMLIRNKDSIRKTDYVLFAIRYCLCFCLRLCLCPVKPVY